VTYFHGSAAVEVINAADEASGDSDAKLNLLIAAACIVAVENQITLSELQAGVANLYAQTVRFVKDDLQ
jgi:hypothetical protein